MLVPATMCDRKSLTNRAASAVGAPQVMPSQFPGGGDDDEECLLGDVVDCVRPMVCQDVAVSGREEESLFERVKKKLRQATMIGSPAKSGSLDRRFSGVGLSLAPKQPTKKTRHSWHQETL